ncbi:hypothetical protein B0H11DRAFT_1999217 [Mycena galericulata]|nr:hypothetical protein B0H11DRAFT_1999217 [Mycena galericulata]
MSVLLMGDDANGQESRRLQQDVYVLTRSFASREKHLRELEQFRTTLPGNNRVLFLPDPLSNEIPSYHANVPLEVRQWLRTRQDVVNVRHWRHPNGLDQPEVPLSNTEYLPGQYVVSCRNFEQLEKHIAELQEFSASIDPHISLNIRRAPQFVGLDLGYNYYANLPGEILEWVKGRDEVINIAPKTLEKLND